MRIKCAHCQNFENGTCSAKSSGGKNTPVKPNKDRNCDLFVADPIVLAAEADKIYEKGKIPIYAPTWRYYATDKELKEAKAEKGPFFVRINPNV